MPFILERFLIEIVIFVPLMLIFFAILEVAKTLESIIRTKELEEAARKRAIQAGLQK